MAVIILGKTLCSLCGKPILAGEDTVGFPAFLPPTHELASFSDGVFHETCFHSDPRAQRVVDIYARYRAIWDSRPKHLQSLAEIEAWGREAFKNFP